MLLERRTVLIAFAMLATGQFRSSDVRADGESSSAGKDLDVDDHHNAAKARAAGQILPVSEILEDIRKKYPGEIVGFELEQEDGRWVYEFKIITPESHFIEVYIDAKDKSLVKVEGK